MSSDYVKSRFFGVEAAGKAVEGVVDGLLDSGSVGVGVGEDVGVGVRDRQVLVRVSDLERERWQAAAEVDGLSVSEWVRGLADGRWRELFVCEHPVDRRRVFPWSEVCLGCGVRLR